jgi:DNA repair exonuclease SbcCD ATPase subunit
VRDQERALKLLKGLDMDRAGQSAQALAALLQQNIEEQDWSGGKITELREKLTQSEARVEELERQLQELTTIEQNIQQRVTPN